MKKPSLTKYCIAVAALVIASPAFAGPVSAEKNVTPMAPAPECNWTGFYIGVNAGITEYQARFTDQDYVWNGSTTTYEKPAFIGGGQIGYNYQWKDLVLGIEADFSGLADADIHQRLDSSDDVDEAEYRNEYNWSQQGKIDFMGTIRGRLGISLLDNKAMIYVTGGGAFAHGKWDVSWTYYPGDYTPSNYYFTDYRGDDWRAGWVGGFGIEYALNCHWSVRAEALYTWLGSDTANVDFGRSGEGIKEEVSYGRQRFEDDLWSYRVGINYKFTGFGGGH
jgi:outer membrane immunogenic protein